MRHAKCLFVLDNGSAIHRRMKCRIEEKIFFPVHYYLPHTVLLFVLHLIEIRFSLKDSIKVRMLLV